MLTLLLTNFPVLILINSETRHQLAAVLFELRLQLRARPKMAAAAGVERAAWRRVQRAWQLTGKFDALAAVVRVQTRRRRQQRLSVRVARIGEDLIFTCPFSTQRPRYITITSSAMCSTTDKSWEINT